MAKYFKNLSTYFFIIIIFFLIGFINWRFPLYIWFGYSPVTRFVWLGIFFLLFDLLLEILLKSAKQIHLASESMTFSRDLKKISASFYLIKDYQLPNNQKADFIAVGSSGVWMITVKDDKGKITFNGDDLIQSEKILKGLITQSLEKSYALAGILKQKLNRDIKVTPVIAFSSSSVELVDIPRPVRGVYATSRKDAVSLIEDTDIQLIDKNTIEEIDKLLKSG